MRVLGGGGQRSEKPSGRGTEPVNLPSDCSDSGQEPSACLFVAAGIVFVTADSKPAGDHMALGIKIVSVALDLFKTGCNGAGVGLRRGIQIKDPFSDPDKTGENLSLTLVAHSFAGIKGLIADFEKTCLQISLAVKVIKFVFEFYKTFFGFPLGITELKVTTHIFPGQGRDVDGCCVFRTGGNE